MAGAREEARRRKDFLGKLCGQHVRGRLIHFLVVHMQARVDVDSG